MSFINSVAGFFFGGLADIGLSSPLSRALGFGAIGFLAQYFLRPGISYVTVQGKKGKTEVVAKEFNLLRSKDSPIPGTYFPWYMWPATTALLGGLVL